MMSAPRNRKKQQTRSGLERHGAAQLTAQCANAKNNNKNNFASYLSISRISLPSLRFHLFSGNYVVA